MLPTSQFQSERRSGAARLSALSLLLVAASAEISAQEAAPLSSIREPIPRYPYKSWSLFIVCNPSWLTPQSAEQVRRLYDQFEAYGAAIGPYHVAVWFKTNNGDLDTARNSLFCTQLRLKPTGSPYLIFTTHYPGKALLDTPATFPSSESDLGNHSVLSLNAMSAADTTRVLGSLADQIVTRDVSKVQVDSREYWSAWQGAYESIRDEVTGLLSGVTVSFDTGFAKVEIPLSKDTAKSSP